MKRAAITGIAGQDGTYLARWLMAKGYEVLGVSPMPPMGLILQPQELEDVKVFLQTLK